METGKIFLCYRRDDSAGHAGRVYDRLNQRFPGRVFMDVAGIGIGTRWAQVIEETLRSCQVAVILVGKRWLEVGPDGARRIDKADDPTRAEIRAVLRLKLRVVPVLVSGAAVPESNDLPSDIAGLAEWQALRIDDDDFDHDTTRLVRALESQLGDHESEPDLGSTGARQTQLARLIADAESAISRGDWIAAAQILKSVLSIDPQHAEGASRLRFVQQQSNEALRHERDTPLRRRGWLSFGIGALRVWVTVGIATIAFVVISIGGMLQQSAQEPPEATDQSSTSPSPLPTQVGSPDRPGSGSVAPSPDVPPPPSKVSPSVPPKPQPSSVPSLAGDYVIVSYSERGIPVPLSGGMRLTEIQPARYQFDTVVINPALGVTLQYRGFVESQGNMWTVTTLQTNDPTALIATPIATQATFDGSMLSMQNSYGQAAVWRKQ